MQISGTFAFSGLVTADSLILGMKKYLLTYTFLLVTLLSATAAAKPADGKTLLTYQIGQSSPDLRRSANRMAYRELLGNLSARMDSGVPTKITISHYSAPDGVNNINRYVGENRAEVIIRDLSARLSLSPEEIEVLDRGAAWPEVRRMVEASSYPARQQIVAAIDANPGNPEAAIRRIDKGKSYSWMKDYVFPAMRSTVAISVSTPAQVAQASVPERPAATAPVREVEPVPQGTVAQIEPEAQESGEKWSPWAFKTNLLYDAALAPSLEVEYRFSSSWSVNLEYEMAWWKNSGADKTYEVAVVSPEARWWFRMSGLFRGHYLGVFPGFTWFDLENGGTGHRGHGLFAGVSYGYTWPISTKLALEAGLGVGYMHLNYKDYEPSDGHNVYKESKTTSYFGPLKAKLTLVWRPWALSPRKKHKTDK